MPSLYDEVESLNDNETRRLVQRALNRGWCAYPGTPRAKELANQPNPSLHPPAPKTQLTTESVGGNPPARAGLLPMLLRSSPPSRRRSPSPTAKPRKRTIVHRVLTNRVGAKARTARIDL